MGILAFGFVDTHEASPGGDSLLVPHIGRRVLRSEAVGTASTSEGAHQASSTPVEIGHGVVCKIRMKTVTLREVFCRDLTQPAYLGRVLQRPIHHTVPPINKNTTTLVKVAAKPRSSARTNGDISLDGSFTPDFVGVYVFGVINEHLINDDPRYSRCRAMHKQVTRIEINSCRCKRGDAFSECIVQPPQGPPSRNEETTSADPWEEGGPITSQQLEDYHAPPYPQLPPRRDKRWLEFYVDIAKPRTRVVLLLSFFTIKGVLFFIFLRKCCSAGEKHTRRSRNTPPRRIVAQKTCSLP